jgi:hypothetical protein
VQLAALVVVLRDRQRQRQDADHVRRTARRGVALAQQGEGAASRPHVRALASGDLLEDAAGLLGAVWQGADLLRDAERRVRVADLVQLPIGDHHPRGERLLPRQRRQASAPDLDQIGVAVLPLEATLERVRQLIVVRLAEQSFLEVVARSIALPGEVLGDARRFVEQGQAPRGLRRCRELAIVLR